MFFDVLYLGVKLVPLLLCLERGLIHLCSACLYDLYPVRQFPHHEIVLWTHHQHLFQKLATFALQRHRWGLDPAGSVVQVHVSSHQSGTFARLPDGTHLLLTTTTPEVDVVVCFVFRIRGVTTQ
jgi:hypothetical protein